MAKENLRDYKDQIDFYQKAYPFYKTLTKIVKNVIKRMLKRELIEVDYIIKGKVKSISQFAYNISRKLTNDDKSTIILTDLSEIHIILPNLFLVEKVCDLIRKNFRVEVESIQGEAYKSICFIVKLHQRNYYKTMYNLFIPKFFTSLKVELKVRTYLQQGWAVIEKMGFNKDIYNVPEAYEQQLVKIASVLEIVDKSFNDLNKKMRDFESNYAFISNIDTQAEIKRLEIVLKADMDNLLIAYKIGTSNMKIEKWDNAIDYFYKCYHSKTFDKLPEIIQASILRDLGISICKKNRKNIESTAYTTGQDFIKTALKINPYDTDGYSALAGTWKTAKKEDRAHEAYKEALKTNPSHPYPLSNYLIYEIRHVGNLDPIDQNRGVIQKAIKKRSKQIAVRIDFPWSNFDVGIFSLFFRRIHTSLHNYLMAIRMSTATWMIKTTLETLDKLERVFNQLKGIHQVRALLLLGIAFHKELDKTTNDGQELLNYVLSNLKVNTKLLEYKRNLKTPVVIIVNGPYEDAKDSLKKLKKNIIDAFEDFEGTILCRGIISESGAIPGDIKEKYPDKLQLIGCIPEYVRTNFSLKLETRCDEQHHTEGQDYSILEVLQYWYDILLSGIDPSKVKLLGIGGDEISALELRVAILFGAQIGILEGGGGACIELTNDKWWKEKFEDKNPYRLFKIIKNSKDDIYNFLTKPYIIDPDIENLRRLIIQDCDDGVILYSLNFANDDINEDLLGGLLQAFDNLGDQIKAGGMISVTYAHIYVTAGFFKISDPHGEKEFKLFFLLNQVPSERLRKKILEYKNRINKEFSDEFFRLRRQLRTFNDPDGKMRQVLIEIFGQEMQKILN